MSSSLQSESNVKKKRRSLFRRKKTEGEMPVEPSTFEDTPLDFQLLDAYQLLAGEYDSTTP